MAASLPSPYRRFPGTGRYLLNRVLLYVGPDHLLQVTATGYSENYRRFFFHDIQVISLHKTVTGTIWNLILGGLLFLFVGLAIMTGGNGLVAWMIFAGAIALGLGINIARGPTCACFIQTAVQQQRLYSLNRVRRARRLIEQLKPILASVQQPAQSQSQILAEPALEMPAPTPTPTPAPAPPESAPPTPTEGAH
ncbi:MAG TPA: hypothetical protein VNU68_00660 [Verrucomicrobiae bacterium]|nr:hypothetical protein [Verrucomicrobiae bacterium]